MTDLRKAAEMALEALEEINRRSVSREHAQLISENAITALRERLAQPEHTAWVTAGEHTVPLKTYPPKREWVGLTDEDKDELLNLDNWTDIVEAVEAKLKEKNT